MKLSYLFTRILVLTALTLSFAGCMGARKADLALDASPIDAAADVAPARYAVSPAAEARNAVGEMMKEWAALSARPDMGVHTSTEWKLFLEKYAMSGGPVAEVAGNPLAAEYKVVHSAFAKALIRAHDRGFKRRYAQLYPHSPFAPHFAGSQIAMDNSQLENAAAEKQVANNSSATSGASAQTIAATRQALPVSYSSFGAFVDDESTENTTVFLAR